jgi:uncharacterized protein YfaP (DUF2135 family)
MALVALTAGAACNNGVKADAGLSAWMRIDGAQFYAGSPSDGDGPAVASVDLLTNAARAGEIGKSCKGALAPGATAVALMLDGDRGYWVLPAGVPDVASPTFPSFHASLSFSRDMPGGNYALRVHAANADGRFGAANSDNVLTVTALGIPQGQLVVSLTWDTEADLDLHVVDPTGAEIFNRNINSYVKPPPGQDAGDPNSGGVLDFDSNANCVIDGLRQEDVVWSETPPTGHYVARVDTFSLCGAVSAHWTVRAFRSSTQIAEASGSSFDSDTRQPHDRGAGVTAIEFDL